MQQINTTTHWKRLILQFAAITQLDRQMEIIQAYGQCDLEIITDASRNALHLAQEIFEIMQARSTFRGSDQQFSRGRSGAEVKAAF